MMRLFRAASAVGVELDTGVIRVVELKGSARKPSVHTTGKIELPPEAVQEGSVGDVEAVARGLQQLWEKYHLSTGNIVLGISNRHVMMRTANFPKGVGKNMAKVVQFQATDFFPIDLSQLVMDFTVLGETDGEKGPELEVLLVAVRKDSLGHCLAPFSKAGLEPRIIDYAPLALVSLISKSQLEKNMIILNISNGISSFLLVAGGTPRFSRAIPLAITVPGLKNTASDPIGNIVSNMDSEWGLALVNEIRSSINYYLTQYAGDDIELLLLGGPGAARPGLMELLQQELQIPAEMIDVPEGPEFTACYGLACRGLDDDG